MKELLRIIEQLDSINRQMIEKDNMIDLMQMVIQVLTQLISDPLIHQLPNYSVLREKYFAIIEEYLRKIKDISNVVIEPQNLTLQTTGKKHKMTRDDVKGPMITDIYLAPVCRTNITKKKTKEVINDIDGFSFDYEGHRYYLSSVEKDHQYPIYDEEQHFAGFLKDATMTFVNQSDDEQLQTKTFMLPVVQTTSQSFLFGSYILSE